MTNPSPKEKMKAAFLERYVKKEDHHNAGVSLDGIIRQNRADLLREIEEGVEERKKWVLEHTPGNHSKKSYISALDFVLTLIRSHMKE